MELNTVILNYTNVYKKKKRTYVGSKPWRLPAPPPPAALVGLGAPQLWARRRAVKGAVFLPPPLITSGWRASERLLPPLGLSLLKLQRPCTSAIAPNRAVKVQRDSTVTPETCSPLFRREAICVHIIITECGKCWKCSSFPVECALLKPSVKSLLACKIVGIFCECPLIKSSLSPWVGWSFL